MALTLNTVVKFGLDLLLPPHCLRCARQLAEPGRLCPDCWQSIHFISAPFCRCCGFPFEFDEGGDRLCAACTAMPPRYDRARAVMRYDDNSRPLVLGFKHGDRTEAARAFGRWMVQSGGELLDGIDCVIPVPLHRWRLARRRYNQSALLAQAVAEHCRRPVFVDLLVRRRHTPTQGGLSVAARQRNVRGAFDVRVGTGDRLDGARVLLVDDVLTTGATAEACARTLRRAGAATVEVLILARVVRPRPGVI